MTPETKAAETATPDKAISSQGEHPIPDPRAGNAIAQWYDRKLTDGYDVRAIRRIGKNFMEVTESSREDQNTRLALLRQNSVVIIPIIDVRGQLFTILGAEYREGAAKILTGFPAGSLDKPGESILNAAARELVEETPLEEGWITGISEIDVGPVNYVSPGGTNEQIFYVKVDVKLPDDVDIHQLSGLVSGVPEEGEQITAYVRKVDELGETFIHELTTEGHKFAFMILLDKLKQQTNG